MSKLITKILLLFPGLALVYFGINLIEFLEFPFDLNLFGRHIHNLRSMTIDGTKSMGNLIEILYVLILGGIGALFLGFRYKKHPFKSKFGEGLFIVSIYFSAFLIYILTPSLPE